MNFVAIDFETANSERHSACEIGLTVVHDFKVVESFSRLIKPRNNWFNSFNTRLHGIDANAVKNEMEFDELWDSELKEYLGNCNLIAHNAGFDIGVLKAVMDQYFMDLPNINYSCSVRLSRKAWPGRKSYSLDKMSDFLGIKLERHHRAGDDAYASAMIALRAFESLRIESFQEINSKLGLKIGTVRKGDYVGFEKMGYSRNPEIFNLDTSKVDSNHKYYQKRFVITGKLKQLTRKKAEVKILEIGGFYQNQIDRNTNYLVVSNSSYSKIKDGYTSKKLDLVADLQNQGYEILIIPEDEFYQDLNLLKPPTLFE